MALELDDSLIESIIFAMEDQEQEYLFDTTEGVLLTMDEVEDADAAGLVPIPDWSSARGFQLMEQFVSGLRNPIARSELHDALLQRRGVFREFKAVLRSHPLIERQWHAYKDKAMRREVFSWWNLIREAWNLEAISEEFDTSEIVAEDFAVHPWQEGHDSPLAELDKAAFLEACRGVSEEQALLWHSRARQGLPHWLCLTIRSPDDQMAGFAWASAPRPASGPDTPAAGSVANPACIRMIYVFPAWRGLGLAKALFKALRTACESATGTRPELEIPGGGGALDAFLEREGYLIKFKCFG